ncbi:MAG: HD domain-containing protein [Treponema sp.]|nr:HD domain-containing protein [Candidatus Treponema caballi]
MGEFLSKDDPFYLDNIKRINRFVVIVLACIIPVGPLFALATLIGMFAIPYCYCLVLTVVACLFTCIQYCTVKYGKGGRWTMFQGFALFLLITTFILVIPGVGVSIVLAFAVIPFLSCLYLNFKFSIGVCFLSYNLFVLGFWFKSEELAAQLASGISHTDWFFSELSGYTMVSVFVLLGTISVSRMLNRAFSRVRDTTMQVNHIQSKLIKAFADTVEFNDETTGLHVKRTSEYVKLIAHRLAEMGYYKDELTPLQIDLFIQAAPLHDIGKFSVPNTILCKPGKYTPEEYEVMKKHAQAGHELIEREFHGLEDEEFVRTASNMAWYHHEKWDGTGYPRGIKGTDIPLCGRIMAAADVLDALLSRRLYKDAFEMEKTFEIIEGLRGKQFEPCIVDALISLKPEISRILSEDGVD